MVLRLLLIFLFCLSFNVSARRSSKSLFVKKAQHLFIKKKYKSSIQYLRKAYNLKNTKKLPPKVLFLLGINNFHIKKYKSSNYYLSKLVKYYFRKNHIRVLRAKRKDTLDELKVSKLQKSIYYYMGQNYFALFKKTNLHQYSKRSLNYLEICEELDFGENVEELIETVQKIKEDAIKKVKHYQFYASAGRILFQDHLLLTNTANSEEITIQSNNQGLCYGAGLRYGNAYSGYDFFGCFFSGSTAVKNVGGSKNYSQSGVPIAGLYLEAGKYYKPYSEKTRIGFGIPVLYRDGSFSDATDGSTVYSIQEKGSFSSGLVLNAGWEFSFMEIQMKQSLLGPTNIFLLQGIINF
jgi:hypothetical protein